MEILILRFHLTCKMIAYFELCLQIGYTIFHLLECTLDLIEKSLVNLKCFFPISNLSENFLITQTLICRHSWSSKNLSSLRRFMLTISASQQSLGSIASYCDWNIGKFLVCFWYSLINTLFIIVFHKKSFSDVLDLLRIYSYHLTHLWFIE